MCLMPVQASLWAHRTKLCLQGLVTIWQQIHAVAATCLPAGEAADIPVSSQGPDHDAGFYVGVKEGFSKKGVGGAQSRNRKEEERAAWIPGSGPAACAKGLGRESL